MEYKITNDKIIIKNCCDFNIKHILECGQVFRYKLIGDDYVVYSKDKCATVKQLNQQNCIEIITKDVEYFENYFDLKNDYSLIKKHLVNNTNNSDIMQKVTDFGNGIRILKQDSFEMIISFVISQNNNIKRIQASVEKLSKSFGTNMGDYFAFPTPKQLLCATEEYYKSFGLGYRSKYLVEVVKAFQNFDYDNFAKLSITEQIQILTSVKGIGPKVADCILLFGFYQMKVFPVDTWIEKVFNQHFNIENLVLNRNQIREKLVELFGEYSGYAQQYLFYYQRVFLKK